MIKSTLVHIETGQSSLASLMPVFPLAARLGARLSGLCPISGIEALAVAYGVRSTSYQSRLAEMQKAAEQIAVWFRKEAAKHGVETDWLTGEGDGAAVTAMASRYFDLIVASREAPVDAIGWKVAEEVLMSGGRPCLVMPPAFERSIGTSVLVGWNSSKESARAVGAALPILQKAQRVTVLVGPPRDQFSAVRSAPQIDIGTSLKHHGVDAELATLGISDAGAGEAILDEARVRGADLVVMGAYGRSWTREWILGGTTQHVLHHAELPVLMSC